MSQYPVTAYWDSYHFEVRLGTPRDPAPDSLQGFNQLYQLVIPYTTSKQAFDLAAIENIAPDWNIVIDHNALTLTITYTGGAFYDFSTLEDGYLRLFTMQDVSEYFNSSFTTFQTNQLITTQSGAAQNSSAGQYFAKQSNNAYAIDWLGYTANGGVYQIDQHYHLTLFNNGELRLGTPYDSPQGTQVPRLRTIQFTLVEGVESVIDWNYDSGLFAAGFSVTYNNTTKVLELTYNAANGTDDYDLYQRRNGDLLIGNFTNATNSFGDYSMTSVSWVMSQYTASRSEPGDGDVVGVYNGTYADLLANGSGGGGGGATSTYHLSIYKDTNELRLGNPTTNAGDTYGGGTVYNFRIFFDDPMNAISGFVMDGSLTGWNITRSNDGMGFTEIEGTYTNNPPPYDMTGLGDSELLLGTIQGAMIDWNQISVTNTLIKASSAGSYNGGTYSGTVDGSYSASSGGAGDPHIQPVFGKKYDLPHVPEVFVLYDNLNKEFPVTIKGKCWFLPESRYITQIKKMLANGYYNRAQKIAKILQTSTFFRYIEFVCGPEHMIVDMEKLTLCEYTNAYDLHHYELPTLNEYVNNKFITIGKLRHASEGFFKRMPAYSTLERNITLNGPFGTVSVKLLRDSRNIMNRNGIVLRASGFKGNEVGALIRRYIKYSDFSTNYTSYSDKYNEPTAYDFEEVIISEAGGCTMYSYDDNESPVVIKDYTNKSMNAVF